MLANAHGGDRGYTSLADGSRARKDASLLAAGGELHEASAAIGMAVTGGYLPEEFDALLRGAQRTLAWCDRRLAGHPVEDPVDAPAHDSDDETAVLAALDALCERYASEEFSRDILNSRSATVVSLESARAVTRRAERSLWTRCFEQESPSAEQAAVFLNRLADVLLIVASRLDRGADLEFPFGACGSTA